MPRRLCRPSSAVGSGAHDRFGQHGDFYYGDVIAWTLHPYRSSPKDERIPLRFSNPEPLAGFTCFDTVCAIRPGSSVASCMRRGPSTRACPPGRLPVAARPHSAPQDPTQAFAPCRSGIRWRRSTERNAQQRLAERKRVVRSYFPWYERWIYDGIRLTGRAALVLAHRIGAGARLTQRGGPDEGGLVAQLPFPSGREVRLRRPPNR